MTLTKETLKRMIEELNLIPLSDKELDVILPEVQGMVEGAEKLSETDLSSSRVSHVFRASP
jgi:hypothetical protein